jgi:hypothetical protein
VPYILKFNPPSLAHYILTTEDGLPYLFRETESAQDWFKKNLGNLLLDLTEHDCWHLKCSYSSITHSVKNLTEAKKQQLGDYGRPCKLRPGITPPPELLWGDIPFVPEPQLTYSEESDTLYFTRDPVPFLPARVDDVLTVCRSAEGPRRVVRIVFTGVRARLSGSQYQLPEYTSDTLYRVLTAASPPFDQMDLHTGYMYELAFTVVGTERVPEDLLKKLLKPRED